MKVCDGEMVTLARRPDVDIGKCNLVMQISIQPSWLPLLCVTIRAAPSRAQCNEINLANLVHSHKIGNFRTMVEEGK